MTSFDEIFRKHIPPPYESPVDQNSGMNNYNRYVNALAIAPHPPTIFLPTPQPTGRFGFLKSKPHAYCVTLDSYGTPINQLFKSKKNADKFYKAATRSNLYSDVKLSKI